MEYYCIYQVQSSNHSQNRKLKSEINNTNFTSFKISIIQIMNTHLKESFLSRTTQSLAWQVKVERSEVFMDGFGKILPFEDLNSSKEYHKFIYYLYCQQLSSSRRGGVGQKSLLFFFSNNYQFQMMLFFSFIYFKSSK